MTRDEYFERLIANLPPMQKLFLDLDVVLTGNPPARVVSHYHHFPKDVTEWAEKGFEPWYLSDGGYSRVLWSMDTGKLYLTGDSRNKVKVNWEVAVPQREALQRYLSEECASLCFVKPI
jgi:hypothetical protein